METPSGVPVDLVVRNDDYRPLYEEALGCGVRMPGVPVPVVSREYLAAMKMAAARDKDTMDLKYLDGELDIAKARQVIARHLGPYAAHEFDRVVEEARWERATNRR